MLESLYIFSNLGICLNRCGLLTRDSTSTSYHVLLCNVTLHVAVWVFILKELGEGGVLGVSIQSHHMLVVTAQLGQSHSIGLSRSNLVTRDR